MSARQARVRPAQVLPGADRLERVGRSLQSVATPDPAEALDDIRLGKKLEGILAPTFGVLGATLEHERLKDEFDEEASSQVTVARGTALRLYFIKVPRFILTDPKKKNRNAIMGLKSLFKKDSRVFMFSENEPYLRFAFEMMFENEWAPEVVVQFIPWGFVSELEEAAEVQRPAMVKHRLGEPTFARANATLESLGEDNREFLVEYMRDQARVASDYFKNIVVAMALPAEFGAEVGGGWTGDLTADARRLLDWAFMKQWFPADSERADYTVAGALLELLTHQTGGDKAKRVGRIVIEHGLIRNQTCLDDLRSRLALTD